MRSSTIVAGLAAALTGCSGPTSPSAEAPRPGSTSGAPTRAGSTSGASTSGPTQEAREPDAAREDASLDPWRAQGGAVRGVSRDAGSCASASGWAEAEAWARAFRMPKEKAPSRGAELPTARLDVEATAKLASGEVRSYRQVVSYPLAERRITRRFVMSGRGDVVVACAVLEEPHPRPEQNADAVRITARGDGLIEVTDRPEPDDDGTGEPTVPQPATHTATHLCLARARALGCVTLPGDASAERVGEEVSYRLDHRTYDLRRGPFLLPLIADAAVIVPPYAATRATTVVGRAMATGLPERRAPPLVEPRIDARGLPPWTDHGACVTAKTKAAPRRDDDGGLRPIGEPTALRWAESFLPKEPRAGRSRRLGELDGGYAVETFSLGHDALSDGDAGHWVFAADPDRVTGCLVYLGPVRYGVVADSYQPVSPRGFTYRLQRREGVPSLGDDVSAEERVVLCTVEDHRMGCVSAPASFTVSSHQGLGEKTKTTEHRARLTPHTTGLTWSLAGRDRVELTLRPGTTSLIPPPSPHVLAPQPREETHRSTLRP